MQIQTLTVKSVKMVARVQHPAPAFKGTAVVDGSFEGDPSTFLDFLPPQCDIRLRDADCLQ